LEFAKVTEANWNDKAQVPMPTFITEERPDTDEAQQLIAELEAVLSQGYAAEFRHGYSVDKLIQQGVKFFVTRHEGQPAGCGGLQFFGQDYAELKRMYVRPQYRGLGLAKLLLTHMAQYAREHGVTVLRLETGVYQTEAIGLYERDGFRRTDPFGDYNATPLNLFFEKRLN
jgi:GNAT superfamily N-acetyltransferase